jgi:FAD synthetase
MNKIINLNHLDNIISQIEKSRKSIVLVGGCFDIIHIGHIKFLSAAKKMGDILIVLLESDGNVKKLKGENRPFFPQKERAELLTTLLFTDFIILLPMMNEVDYIQLILKIKPKIIACTVNDPIIKKKILQAKSVGAKIKKIAYIKTYSSSSLAKKLGIE